MDAVRKFGQIVMDFRSRIQVVVEATFVVAFIWGAPSYSQAEPDRAHLVVELGRHTDDVWRVSTDHQGRFGASVSQDNSLRIWDVQAMHQVGVLRPPLNDEGAGLFDTACAMSPDGKFVAAAVSKIRSGKKRH